MTLTTGARIGPYEITGIVGAGGMGEVYRARDARLNRDVAIKVIPPSFATDPERVLRFEQEARAAAALSHPNILVVHDLGTHELAPYIVTELLEGETLREHIARGPMLARTAIDFAVQVARGLAAAHEKGIVHRDLKPENVFVTLDGRVKILDFGLAKLTQVEVAGLGSMLPTTPPLMSPRVDTTPGMVLGTIGYMAPEQVRGATADHRADIFALGAILYEMLTARRAFRGDSTIETMTAILRDQPGDLAESDRPVSPGLRRIVEHCLEKRPESRFQSAQDVAFALDAISGATESRIATAVDGSGMAAAKAAPPRAAAWMIATGVAVVAAIAMAPFALSHWRERPAAPRVARFVMGLPPDMTLTLNGSVVPSFEISPDGQRIALKASVGAGISQLWVRALDSLTMRPLAGTENVGTFFWAPDSNSVAFTSEGRLKAVRIDGGAPQTIAPLPQAFGFSVPSGGAWSREGAILLGSLGGIGGQWAGIWRVDANGGAFSLVTKPDQDDDSFYGYPVFLPDGRRFLFAKLGSDQGGTYLAGLDGEAATRVSADNIQPRLAGGFLFFARGQSLLAQPFDAVAGRVVSNASVVVDDVTSNPVGGRAGFSVSEAGVLIVASGEIGRSQFTWFTRAGQPDGTVGNPDAYYTVGLSPDGRKVVYGLRESAGTQSLWVTDLVRTVTTRLTFGASRDSDGTWSPDMSRIAYASIRKGDKSLYEVPASGGIERLILKAEGRSRSIDDWSPDGRFILYHLDGARELWALPVGEAGKPTLVVKPPSGRVDEPTFSPDGRWIAYTSEESGRFEVYVAPFPPTGARWQVSSAGGVQPTWRRDGRELFFLGSDGTMKAARIELGGTAGLGTADTLFQTRLTPSGSVDQYAVSPDGKRFLIMNPIGETEAPPTVILDWQALLKR